MIVANERAVKALRYELDRAGFTVSYRAATDALNEAIAHLTDAGEPVNEHPPPCEHCRRIGGHVVGCITQVAGANPYGLGPAPDSGTGS